METKNLIIGNLFNYRSHQGVIISGLHEHGAYIKHPNQKYGGEVFVPNLKELEPIEISEKYLLDFGFKKVEETFDDFYHDVSYELETKEVFFSYSDDWSLAIADSKKSFQETSNYITPDK